MTIPLLPALAVWRRRGDTRTYDALWSAAGWEAEAERLIRERPNCKAATYTPDAEERRLREAEAKRNRRKMLRGKPTVSAIIPYLHASAELALDLSARRRVEDYLQRADDALAEDGVALLLVVAEENRLRVETRPCNRPIGLLHPTVPRVRPKLRAGLGI